MVTEQGANALVLGGGVSGAARSDIWRADLRPCHFVHRRRGSAMDVAEYIANAFGAKGDGDDGGDDSERWGLAEATPFAEELSGVAPLLASLLCEADRGYSAAACHVPRRPRARRCGGPRRCHTYAYV